MSFKLKVSILSGPASYFSPVLRRLTQPIRILFCGALMYARARRLRLRHPALRLPLSRVLRLGMFTLALCNRKKEGTNDSVSLQVTLSAIHFIMIKPLVSKLIGFVICIWVLIPSLVAAIFKGWSYVFGKKNRTKPPDILHDPRWGSHRHAQLPGLRMHYVEKGDYSKPLMIFVHGFPEFWFSWRFQIEYFAKDYW